jgi:hypothetical protein
MRDTEYLEFLTVKTYAATLRPLALSNLPSEAAVMPFPSPETTPPVTKMYFVMVSHPFKKYKKRGFPDLGPRTPLLFTEEFYTRNRSLSSIFLDKIIMFYYYICMSKAFINTGKICIL